MVRDVPLDPSGQPCSQHTDQSRLYACLRIEEMIIVGQILGLENSATNLRQYSYLNVLVAQFDDLIVLVLNDIRHHIVKRVRVDVAFRSLINPTGEEDRVNLRSSDLIGRNSLIDNFHVHVLRLHGQGEKQRGCDSCCFSHFILLFDIKSGSIICGIFVFRQNEIRDLAFASLFRFKECQYLTVFVEANLQASDHGLQRTFTLNGGLKRNFTAVPPAETVCKIHVKPLANLEPGGKLVTVTIIQEIVLPCDHKTTAAVINLILSEYVKRMDVTKTVASCFQVNADVDISNTHVRECVVMTFDKQSYRIDLSIAGDVHIADISIGRTTVSSVFDVDSHSHVFDGHVLNLRFPSSID